MIGYPIGETALTDKIRAFSEQAGKSPDAWLKKARAATKKCLKAKAFVDQGSLWSEIKDVYTRHQQGKCCYCERKLESPAFGRVEHDVEHFRPKSHIAGWFSSGVVQYFSDWPGTLRKSGASANGYYKLAFDARNYAVSCKTCNSALKRDHFPIAGRHRPAGGSPAALSSEKPFLIFPLADWDEAPEALIEFEGITAIPTFSKATDLFRHWRARVTIRFFRLNRDAPRSDGEDEEGRENLYRERAEALNNLAKSLRLLNLLPDSATEERTRQEEDVKRLTSPGNAHASCCRSFLRMWLHNKTRAVEQWRGVVEYLQSQGFPT
jgi:5-methylcytosine-specific restriction endonuclease McrA